MQTSSIDPQNFMLLLMCTMILLPIVPAYLLFHALPSGNAAEVTGPWQGLNLKLGGAFAGYFIVVLMIFSAYHQVKPKEEAPFEVWKVNGNITGTDNKEIGPVSAQDFTTDPSWLGDPEGSDFHMYVFTRPGTGTTEYPTIHIRHGDKEAYVNLDPHQPQQNGPPIIRWDTAHHTVSIKDVTFTATPSYNGNLPVVQLSAPVVPPVPPVAAGAH